MKFGDCVFWDEAYDNILIRQSAAGGGEAVQNRICVLISERVLCV